MSPKSRGSRDVAEIATLVLSLGIVAALVAGVIFVQLAGGDRPPEITASASLADVRSSANGHYLPVAVRNDGDQAAVAIRLVVTQDVDGQTIDHEIEIEFLAGGAVTRATVVLSADPRTSKVVVRVRSFQTGD